MPNDQSTPGPSPRAGEEEQEYERLAQWCDKRSGTHHEAYETAFVDTTAIARFRRIAQLLRAAAQGGEGDTRRLDWLEGELEREEVEIKSWEYRRPLFRQNTLITRAAIDSEIARRSPDHEEGSTSDPDPDTLDWGDDEDPRPAAHD